MKILVIHPGHAFSTADVYAGLVDGLRANGAEVITYDLMQTLLSAAGMVNAAIAVGLLPQERSGDYMGIAGAGIPGMAMWHQVDAAIAVTGSNVRPAIPATLRRGGILTALLCTESPYLTATRERNDAQCYDVVFTNDRGAVPLFGHPRVSYLPAAYHPARHRPVPPDPALTCDAFFTGTLFPERKTLFDGVDWTDITRRWHVIDYSADIDPDLALAGVIDNADIARYYASAAININHHRTTADYHSGGQTPPGLAQSIGPRAYEIAACGGFQVCDAARPELAEVFGGTVPTYHDSGSLERLIRHYLRRPDERECLAAAQHEAVQCHDWTARARTVIEVLDAARSLRRAA